MRIVAVVVPLLLLLAMVGPVFGQEAQKPEAVTEKMAFKLARGVTNLATAVVELPKQSYLTVRDRGKVGYVIGPLKGLSMTFYRAFIGAVETVFFLVPQPGYYDPMIDPEYVWRGWEERRPEGGKAREAEQDAPPGGKGE